MTVRSAELLKLAVVFAVAFSLVGLPGSLTTGIIFLGPPLVLASSAPADCHAGGPLGQDFECWFPAGPAMDTEQAVIFTDIQAELANLQSPSPAIDLTDEPLSPSTIPPLLSNPNIYVSSAVSLHSYIDIQFLLANNFWGCYFDFGNSTCGIDIRQGIAHMIDKSKFVSNDPFIAGLATAVDNPVPVDNGGLLTPNPCAWDASFPQSSSQCVVESAGGTSYHLANATGANGQAWLQAPGSKDLNAAAAHFVLAGIATGCDGGTGTASCMSSTDSRLSGISSNALAHVPVFFIRNDDPSRLHMGDSLAEQVCYMFTGSYAIPCPYLAVTHGPITAFPGYNTSGCGPGFNVCTTSVNLDWWMYTGGFSDIYPFDQSLYFTYNSKFVSGIPSIQRPNGPCSAGSVLGSTPANYMYLCSSSYDTISSEMEFAPCLTTTGDPVPGQTSNNGTSTCPGTSQPSAYNAGIQTENSYGKGAYSIPIFDVTSAQYAYLNNWQRVIPGDGVGIPNYFTWLNAYSPNPAVPGTVRQGFSQTTKSVNPYVAETAHDYYIVGNIYDSLAVQNPLSTAQIIDWMATENQIPPQALTYIPPPGTVSSFRFTLRSDLFFQDSRKVTSFDVAFSYLSLIAAGAFQSSALAPITGITILGPSQFDINVNGVGPFTLNHLTSPTVLPGRYWTSSGSSAWDSNIATCTATGAPCYPAQYTLNPTSRLIDCALTCTFPASLMNVDVAKIGATYDPIANHILVGSGPWECGPVTSSGSSPCGPCSAVCPPVGGTYALTRFGKGLAPANSVQSVYFRSGGNLALWTWTLDDGDIIHDFLNFSVVAGCFGSTDVIHCGHWMMGIGGCGGVVPQQPCMIGLQQVSEVSRYVGMNWVAPFNWQSSPPAGIAPFAPVIYEGGYTLNPASVAGCNFPFPNSGYDC